MSNMRILVMPDDKVMCEDCKKLFQLARSVADGSGMDLLFFLPLSKYCPRCNPQLKSKETSDGEKTMSEGVPT